MFKNVNSLLIIDAKRRQKKGPRQTDRTPQEVLESFERRGRDTAYFDSNREGLTRKYPDMFVAIFGEQVIGHDRNQERLIRELHEKGYYGFYVERTYSKEEPPTWILAIA